MCLHGISSVLRRGPQWLPDLFRKLLVADIAAQLPGRPLAELPTIGAEDARRLLGQASVYSLSLEHTERSVAYEIATRLIESLGSSSGAFIPAADVILSRIGNFPGRRLLRSRFASSTTSAPGAPASLALERIGRELENTVLGPDGRPWALTDFQHELLGVLDTPGSVSISAPTSAGKSFVLGMDLVRRLQRCRPACVVYIVPTRALIREVTLSLRQHLRKAKMDTVPVRSVPFPITPTQAPHGAVFVLTQERLLTLLNSRDGDQWVSTLIVDEAQSIRDEARGVILQSAIEAVLTHNPQADVCFACPQVSNPEFLLRVIHRHDRGTYLIRTESPVSQNLILVSPVHRKRARALFRLAGDGGSLDLGMRDLDFELRGSTYRQRAEFARAVTHDDESTLLFANNPSDTEALAEELIAGHLPPRSVDPEIQELIEFIAADIHSEYPLIRFLAHGVACHYGFMPTIVRSRVEDLYRGGKLKFVCCTSTLLQGVNLPARHIIIENPKRGRGDAMSRADFLNLAGRAGRLLHEFHGNVWCLRPDEWQEKSFKGDELTPIASAMDRIMADGGTLVQKVLKNEASGTELDFGEAALGKLYVDCVRRGQDLANSSWRTDANADALALTARQMTELRVGLPTDVLDTNRAVRPDRLQALYERLRREPDVVTLVPLHPGIAGANDRMGTIIQIVQETLGGVDNKSYLFYKWLAIQWIYNVPLSRIISQRLAYLGQQKTRQSLGAAIRELLKTLEEAIRFRLVKYFMAYNSILELVLRERGENGVADGLEPFHIYLECGASDRVALNLIALGLSRSTALALRDGIHFAEDADPEGCLGALAAADLSSLGVPSLCLREVMDLLGRSQREPVPE